MIGTRPTGIPAPAPWAGILEHDKVPFISYPYEWTFGMLREAALLQLELLEAARHIDLKQATQLIYDAVWSDPSDPSKTYQNAAQAVMGELRRRAGISAVMGPLQTLAH